MECLFCHKESMTLTGECTKCGCVLPDNSHPGTNRKRYHWPNADPPKRELVGGCCKYTEIQPMQ